MSEYTALTPEELKEVQDYLKKKNIDLQIQVHPQNVRRMEDAGLVIDPPTFSTTFVKIKSKKPNNKIKGV